MGLYTDSIDKLWNVDPGQEREQPPPPQSQSHLVESDSQGFQPVIMGEEPEVLHLQLRTQPVTENKLSPEKLLGLGDEEKNESRRANDDVDNRKCHQDLDKNGAAELGVIKGRLTCRKIFIGLFLVSLPCVLFYDGYKMPTCGGDQVKGWLKLKHAMKSEVFGQHIATDGVLRSLYAHITDPQPKKALVLCFHGWLGSGKTHVSQLIAKHLYQDVDGIGSSSVKSFIGPRHFLLDSSKLKENQDKLVKIVEDTVRNCGQSLFIFDEVDKMPPEVFDGLFPFLDHHDSVDGLDYRKAMFIFLSNTGGGKMNEKLIKIMGKGKREDMTIYDFRDVISSGAFNERGGLFQSELITRQLVDHYIPFLQLERQHVILCAKKEIQRRNVLYITPEKIADRVNYLNYEISSEHGEKIYTELAVDGCKSIMTHVAYFVHDSVDAFNNPGHDSETEL